MSTFACALPSRSLGPVQNLFSFNMRRRSKISAAFIASILAVSMVAAGCDTSWVGKVVSVANTIEPIVVQLLPIVLQLAGVGAQESTKLQTLFNEVSADANKISDLSKQWQTASASAKPGFLSDINTTVGLVNSNLSEILTIVHISSGPLVEKITTAVGLLAAAVADIVANIPGAAPITQTAPTSQAAVHARTATHTANIKSGADLKKAWNTLMTTPSGDQQVDTLCAKHVIK